LNQFNTFLVLYGISIHIQNIFSINVIYLAITLNSTIAVIYVSKVKKGTKKED
jgi:hypothetical protein